MLAVLLVHELYTLSKRLGLPGYVGSCTETQGIMWLRSLRVKKDPGSIYHFLAQPCYALSLWLSIIKFSQYKVEIWILIREKNIQRQGNPRRPESYRLRKKLASVVEGQGLLCNLCSKAPPPWSRPQNQGLLSTFRRCILWHQHLTWRSPGGTGPLAAGPLEFSHCVPGGCRENVGGPT